MVPAAAGRSLWVAAAWTGFGAVVVGAVAGIAAAAICWLPASGARGNAGSAIHAGLLTFLAGLHGGITVDGLASDFVPLGLTLLVGAIAWRAGSGLADAADALECSDPAVLAKAAALQCGVFALCCGITSRVATLGTSSVSTTAAVIAGLLLFAVTGTVSFVRSSPLADELRDRLPEWLGTPMRAAAAGVVGYLGAGALLVAASLVVHHGRVETISHQVGGGWSGAPVLLLGILGAPNAAIAGASYLAGPGFAVGSGVSLGSAAHGTLPAFPLLGALPSGPASSAAWLLAAATPVAAGLGLAQVARRAPNWPLRFRDAAIAAALAGVAGSVLAWLGGGAIGSGRLSTVGASPLLFGPAIAAGLIVVAEGALAALAALEWWRNRDAAAEPALLSRPPFGTPERVEERTADESAESCPPVGTPERDEERTTRAG